MYLSNYKSFIINDRILYDRPARHLSGGRTIHASLISQSSVQSDVRFYLIYRQTSGVRCFHDPSTGSMNN